MTTRQIGTTTVTRVEEALRPGFEPRQLLPDWDPEVLVEHGDWLSPNYYDKPSGRFMSSIHSWVIRTRHHTILIDTCVGNHKNRPAFERFHMLDTPYLDRLAAAGVQPEQVDYVMCTHLHVDHVGWNTRLIDGRWVPTFPKARYLFADKEFAYWNAENAKAPVLPFADSVLPIVAAGRHELVSSAHELDDHIRLLPTPGHTPDHFAVAMGRGHDAAVITGDLIHSPIQARYPELSMRADVDPVQSGATRRAFLERYCDTDTICCTAHFGSPSRVRVRRWGEGFRCDGA